MQGQHQSQSQGQFGGFGGQHQSQSQGQFGGFGGQHQSQSQSQGGFGGFQSQHQVQGQWYKRSGNDKSKVENKKESVVLDKIVAAQKPKDDNSKVLDGNDFLKSFISY